MWLCINLSRFDQICSILHRSDQVRYGFYQVQYGFDQILYEVDQICTGGPGPDECDPYQTAGAGAH